MRRWSLARQFLVASSCVLLVNGLIIGTWIGQQIQTNVLHNAAVAAALFVDSIVTPYLQPLAQQRQLTASQVAALDQVLTTKPLSERVAAIKVWAPDGSIIYSPNRALIGRHFEVDDDLSAALHGKVATDISDLRNPENEYERQHWSRLQQIYVPVRPDGGGPVIAVTEFYQQPDVLEGAIAQARWESWAVVAGLTLTTYLLLVGIVGRGSTTIQQQQHALNDKVAELQRLLDQNVRLHERVRQAAERTTALNEQALRRISADLHDGPAQALALALLRMEHLAPDRTHEPPGSPDFAVVNGAVNDALREIRAIAAGLLLPELDGLSVREVVERAARDHQRHSATPVQLLIRGVPERVPLAVTIALFRSLQEALSNATRHGGGIEVSAQVWSEGDQLCLSVSDGGPGLAAPPSGGSDATQLGLAGMRERAQLLGGDFRLTSEVGHGTTVYVSWPLKEAEQSWNQQRSVTI